MKDIFDKDESKYAYNINLDYDAANPFKKLFFIGTGSYSIGALIFNISLRIAIGAATELSFIGGVYVAGASAIIGGLGLFLIIPGVVGVGIYEIYRFYKNRKVKELYEGLRDNTNTEYALERELYFKTLKEFESFIFGITRNKYREFYRENVIANTKDLIQRIYLNKSKLSKNDLQKYIESIKNALCINNKDTIKVILIGKTGVGKSTLINNILELKNNMAKVNSNEPQKIEEGWPKKYPVNKKDTEINWLEIYDTEGIEIESKSDDKSSNDIDNHLKKVYKYIDENKNNPEKRIDVIWYCISGCRFEKSEEKYIEKLLEIYKDFNIRYPLQFLYLKAYKSNMRDYKEIKKN